MAPIIHKDIHHRVLLPEILPEVSVGLVTNQYLYTRFGEFECGFIDVDTVVPIWSL